MAAPIRDSSPTDLPPLPRPTVYATGITCGIFVAIAVEVLLSRAGIELAGTWRDLIALQLSSAGAWWLMAGSAFLASAVIAAVLSRLPSPWDRFRWLRWILGAAVVFALAEVGRLAAEMDGSEGGVHVAATLVALLAATLMALIGAYVAYRR